MADETSYGWAGKILRVNLSTGSITTQPTDPYKEYIGGMGLANKIMYDEVPAGTDPFSPENKLIFAVGPLTASGVPLAGRTTICSLSTFTKDHLVVDAHCGGMIGAKIKLAGWDAVAETRAGAEAGTTADTGACAGPGSDEEAQAAAGGRSVSRQDRQAPGRQAPRGPGGRPLARTSRRPERGDR